MNQSTTSVYSKRRASPQILNSTLQKQYNWCYETYREFRLLISQPLKTRYLVVAITNHLKLRELIAYNYKIIKLRAQH
ncbi:hypothetical protein PRUPE_6G033000 [Prunus persica]|uniref:Uncharacterized protein n=1 Tax=Prunus persica TaxID=3760 RepID=A0A251NJI8_PRUPE|nr:hypothetical protein PRUPE_6G033000 [Prunus persica]